MEVLLDGPAEETLREEEKYFSSRSSFRPPNLAGFD